MNISKQNSEDIEAFEDDSVPSGRNDEMKVDRVTEEELSDDTSPMQTTDESTKVSPVQPKQPNTSKNLFSYWRENIALSGIDTQTLPEDKVAALKKKAMRYPEALNCIIFNISFRSKNQFDRSGKTFQPSQGNALHSVCSDISQLHLTLPFCMLNQWHPYWSPCVKIRIKCLVL